MVGRFAMGLSLRLSWDAAWKIMNGKFGLWGVLANFFEKVFLNFFCVAL
jgi:hypothetical protein